MNGEEVPKTLIEEEILNRLKEESLCKGPNNWCLANTNLPLK